MVVKYYGSIFLLFRNTCDRYLVVTTKSNVFSTETSQEKPAREEMGKTSDGQQVSGGAGGATPKDRRSAKAREQGGKGEERNPGGRTSERRRSRSRTRSPSRKDEMEGERRRPERFATVRIKQEEISEYELKRDVQERKKKEQTMISQFTKKVEKEKGVATMETTERDKSESAGEEEAMADRRSKGQGQKARLREKEKRAKAKEILNLEEMSDGETRVTRVGDKSSKARRAGGRKVRSKEERGHGKEGRTKEDKEGEYAQVQDNRAGSAEKGAEKDEEMAARMEVGGSGTRQRRSEVGRRCENGEHIQSIEEKSAVRQNRKQQSTGKRKTREGYQEGPMDESGGNIEWDTEVEDKSDWDMEIEEEEEGQNDGGNIVGHNESASAMSGRNGDGGARNGSGGARTTEAAIAGRKSTSEAEEDSSEEAGAMNISYEEDELEAGRNGKEKVEAEDSRGVGRYYELVGGGDGEGSGNEDERGRRWKEWMKDRWGEESEETQGCKQDLRGEREEKESMSHEVQEGRRASQEGTKGESKKSEKSVRWKVVGPKKRKGFEKGRESRLEQNPAMKHVLQKRGQRMIDRKIKTKINLTIEMFYNGEEGTFHPRKKMREMMERMKREDETLTFCAGEKVEEIGDIENMDDEEFHEVFSVDRRRKRKSVVAKLTIRTEKSLNGLKHDNGGRFVEWLKKEKTLLTLNKWKHEPYATIGFIIGRHPTVTWKKDLESEVARHLGQEMAARGDKGEVPKVVLYHDRKSFGSGEKRVHATVIHVQCREEDAEMVKGLLGRGKSSKRVTYIPAGYHLSTSPSRMMEVLNYHNEYVNSRRVVAIVGISEEQMNREVDMNGTTRTVRQHMCEKLSIGYIEKTSRSGDLGKWLLVTTKEEYLETKRKVDEVLGELGKILGEGGRMPGVGHPRRTDRAVADEKYKEYLESLEEIVPRRAEEQLPVLQVQNAAKKQVIREEEWRKNDEEKSYRGAVTGQSKQRRLEGSTREERSMEVGRQVKVAAEGVGKNTMRSEEIEHEDGEIKEMKKRNEELVRRQEASVRELNEARKEMSKSNEQYDCLKELVAQQTKQIEKWLGNQLEDRKLLETLMKEKNEDRMIIKQTQEQVHQICKWIQRKKGSEDEKEDGIGMSGQQVVEGDSRNGRRGNNTL